MEPADPPSKKEEDSRKLHAEINQLVNQRFLLNTTAIALYGVANGWMFQKLPGPAVMTTRLEHWLGFVYSGIVLTCFFCLFCYSQYLGYILRTFSIYLELRVRSQWEKEWRVFRNAGSYFSYSKATRYLFAMLGLMSQPLPLIYSRGFCPALIGTLLLLATYILLISINPELIWKTSEEELEAQWRKVLKLPEADPAADASLPPAT